MAEQAGTSSSAPAAAEAPSHTNPQTETAQQQGASAAHAVQPSPQSQSQPPRAFSQEEVNSFLATERRKWAESEELKGLRAKAKRADELEAAQLTESEKLTRRATEAEARASELEARYRDAAIRARFATSALAAGIPAERIDAAYKLADLGGVSLSETGNVTGVDEAVKALPEWLRAAAAPAARPAPDISAGAGGHGTAAIDPAAREADIRRRFRL